jgi:hypothetical protein
MARKSTAVQPTSTQPANVKGAQRNHPYMRVVRPSRPTALYEIVHGAVVMPDPDHVATEKEPFRLTHYFPGEVLQLDGPDADILLQRGIVVELGEAPILNHTMPDREVTYYDKYRTVNGQVVPNPDPEPEGRAQLMKIDIEAATAGMYGADSSSTRLGGLNGSGR